jgi:hypothetical protein
MNVIAHNQESSQAYKKGINGFSDFSDDEFMNYFNLADPQNECSATHSNKYKLTSLYSSEQIPTSWDWRDINGVTPVKS